MPVRDLRLSEAPAQVCVDPVDDGREVDQPGVDVAQLDVPILEALDELLHARKSAGPRLSFLRPSVAESRVRDRLADLGRVLELLTQLYQGRREMGEQRVRFLDGVELVAQDRAPASRKPMNASLSGPP